MKLENWFPGPYKQLPRSRRAAWWDAQMWFQLFVSSRSGEASVINAPRFPIGLMIICWMKLGYCPGTQILWSISCFCLRHWGGKGGFGAPMIALNITYWCAQRKYGNLKGRQKRYFLHQTKEWTKKGETKMETDDLTWEEGTENP